jgi:hypothetical protein
MNKKYAINSKSEQMCPEKLTKQSEKQKSTQGQTINKKSTQSN